MADVINPQWKTGVIAKINNVADCDDLEAYANKVVADMSKQLADAVASSVILDKINDYLPITVPTDLSELLTFAQDIIDLLTDFITDFILGPYNKMQDFITEMTTFQTQVITAITAKIAALSCGFSAPTP